MGNNKTTKPKSTKDKHVDKETPQWIKDLRENPPMLFGETTSNN